MGVNSELYSRAGTAFAWPGTVCDDTRQSMCSSLTDDE
jgi:hypothetical protein